MKNAMAIDTAYMRSVLGRHPTGVVLITSKSEAGETLAMVVGSFTSVSLDPPLVGFLPDKRSDSWSAIARTGRFMVSTLAFDQVDECRSLAGKVKRLSEAQWIETTSGLPVLARALATIECEIASVVEAGDHWFVMGQVRELGVHRDVPPLLFLNGQLVPA